MSVRTSIVVPVYNDATGLRMTLDSLVDQTADDYEVVVVDNGSTDASRSVADAYEAEYEFVSAVAETDIQGSYAARNKGISRSTGRVVGFLDANTSVDEDFVEAITRSVQETGNRYVGCNMEVFLPENPTSVSRYNRATGFPVAAYLQTERFAPTACLVVDRELLDEVGWFDERLVSGGDLEFGRRVAAADVAQVFDPDVTVYHPARTTLVSILRKNVRVGRGLEQLTVLHPERFARDASFLHPQHYLPVHPVRFYRRHRQAARSRTEVGWWYFVSWLEGVSKTIGRIKQRYGSGSLGGLGRQLSSAFG